MRFDLQDIIKIMHEPEFYDENFDLYYNFQAHSRLIPTKEDIELYNTNREEFDRQYKKMNY